MIVWEVITDPIPASSGLTPEQVELAKELTIMAAQYWGRHIDADVTLTIQLRLGTTEPVFGNVLEGLAFSTSLMHVFNRRENGQEIVEPGATYEMRTGIDPNGSTPDIVITLHPDKLNLLALDTTPETSADVADIMTAGQVDFLTLIMHELGHSLGLTSFAMDTPINAMSRISVMDASSTDTSTGRFFVGENAVDVLGAPVPLTGGHIGLPIDSVDDPFSLPETEESLTFHFDVFRDAAYTQFRAFVSSLDIAMLQDLGVPILEATVDDDLLYGFHRENDWLKGLAGDDTLYGLSGADALWGHDGNDSLFGGNGADTLGGGAGNDFLVGDDIDNVGTFLNHPNPPELNLDNDTLYGGAGNDIIITGAFNDTNNNASYDDGEALVGATDSNIVWAGKGDDTIIATDGAETLGGGQGNDFIQAWGGDDIVYGGKQTDVIDGELNDRISLGEGNDTVFAGVGDDSISGGAGDDLIFNGAGSDTVFGGDGDDTLWGGQGDDVLSGGSGGDVFAFIEASGNDQVLDFDTSQDTLDFTAFGLSPSFDLRSIAAETVVSGQVVLTLQLATDMSVTLTGLGLADLGSVSVLI